jgi:hypothetical protein
MSIMTMDDERGRILKKAAVDSWKACYLSFVSREWGKLGKSSVLTEFRTRGRTATSQDYQLLRSDSPYSLRCQAW